MLLRKKSTEEWKEVSRDECAEIIKKYSGIDINNWKSAVEFKQKGHKNVDNAVIRYRASTPLLPKFTVNDGNNTVSFAYCHSYNEEIDGKTGKLTLNMNPKAAIDLGICWKGTQNLTVPLSEYDRIAYLVLYYDSNTSPYRIKRKRGVVYEVYNPKTAASNEYEKNKFEAIVRYEILNTMSIKQLRVYLQSKKESHVDQLTEEQVRNRVLQIAETLKNPSSQLSGYDLFKHEISMPSVQMMSKIQMMLDYKVILLKELRGVEEWRFNFGEQKGDPICAVVKGKSAGDCMVEFLQKNPEVYDLLRTELERAINREQEPEQEVVVEEKIVYVKEDDITHIEGLVNVALKEGVIEYDREKGNAIFIDPQTGNKLAGGGVICKIESRPNMKQEIINHLKEDVKAPAKVQKLREFLTPVES